MSFDDYFFTRPGFLNGVGRAIDLGGVLGREAIKTDGTPAEADCKAIASDFKIVGKDMAAAMNAIAPDAAK
jgi:hypothetical protein